jgi:hypothetical protein
MTPELLGGIAFVIACLLSLGIVCFEFYRKGYQRGFTAGENWVVDAETGVEQEREKIWRAE